MLTNKKWIVRNHQSSSESILNVLLENRGVKPEDFDSFLNPRYEDLTDPMTLSGIKIFIKRLKRAVEAGEQIGIFADYDADGIPAGALLYEGIIFIQKLLNAKSITPQVFIPTREQGYGLSQVGIDTLHQKGVKLIIAVDLGVTAQDEVDYAKKQGIDVMIIDHHLVQTTKLPAAYALINPKKSNDKHEDKDKCACGLAWAVLAACCRAMAGENSKQQVENWLKWQLDLVAISTISDMVPLLGDNRILTKFGLQVLRKTKRIGLKALFEVSGIDQNLIDPYIVGFQIAPRLNAPGRLLAADQSFELLISKDIAKAFELAAQLNRLNIERQQELDRVLRQAIEEVEANKLHKNKILLVARSGWVAGVVGLVAGRLMDRYNMPAIVLEKQAKQAKGSARSIMAFPLVEQFEKLSHLFIKFGGHARAAGLTLSNSNLKTLYKELSILAKDKITDEDIAGSIHLDSIIELKECNIQFCKLIDKMQPFGMENPRPQFLIQNATLSSAKKVGKASEHLQLSFGSNGQNIQGIAFGNAVKFNFKIIGKQVEIAGYPQLETWNGRTSCKIIVQDIRLS